MTRADATPHPAPRHERVGLLLVVVQMVLLALLLLAGLLPSLQAGPALPAAVGALLSVLGWLLVAAGAVLATLGITGLGSSLRANPVPAAGGELRTAGVYAWVRHPVYAGLLAGATGWVLVVRSWAVLVVAVALAVLLAVKARWEESLLAGRYPGYADYAARTSRFVPRPPRRTGAAT